MKKTYEELKELELRILQLKSTALYLAALFEGKPFVVKVEAEYFGHSVHMPFLNLAQDRGTRDQLQEEDSKDILLFIEKRIADLEKEFNESK